MSSTCPLWLTSLPADSHILTSLISGTPQAQLALALCLASILRNLSLLHCGAEDWQPSSALMPKFTSSQLSPCTPLCPDSIPTLKPQGRALWETWKCEGPWGETTQRASEGTCSAQPGEEKTEGWPCSCLQFPHQGKMRGSTEFFSLIISDWTQENGLSQGRFRLGIRSKFFTQRVIMHRHRLAREGVTAPNLTEF